MAGFEPGLQSFAPRTARASAEFLRSPTRRGVPQRTVEEHTRGDRAARPRLVILNVMALALALAAWRAGFLAAFARLGWQEGAFLALLGAYTAVGLGAAWRGEWDIVRRVANALPAWGLAFTGLGLLLAASGLDSLTPAALSQVFRELVFAVAPNIVGVLGFAWLTALANWAAGEDT